MAKKKNDAKEQKITSGKAVKQTKVTPSAKIASKKIAAKISPAPKAETPKSAAKEAQKPTPKIAAQKEADAPKVESTVAKTASRDIDLSRPPAMNKLLDIGTEIYQDVKRNRRPHVSIPVRNLSNVTFAPRKGFFVIGNAKSHRTLSYQTVKTFAQTLRMMAFAKHLIATDDFASKREVYYTSKGARKGSRSAANSQAGWGAAGFAEQPESDAIMEDVEAMAGVNREQLGFIPAEQNGSVAGKLIVIDTDPITKKRIEIDCTTFGRGSYSIPSRLEGIHFRTDAKFLLVVETAALFERLNGHAYWKSSNCIIVAMGGVPTRACRRFVRMLSDECRLPVYAFTDGDPYGYCNIYRTLKVGSGNAAHISEFFCVPNAHFLGVTPHDIEEYDLPTHPLEETDIKRANDALKNDPFFQHHQPWIDALKKMIDMKVRVEQQAFAAHGLNYVLETYLPEKLKALNKMLP